MTFCSKFSKLGDLKNPTIEELEEILRIKKINLLRLSPLMSEDNDNFSVFDDNSGISEDLKNVPIVQFELVPLISPIHFDPGSVAIIIETDSIVNELEKTV